MNKTILWMAIVSLFYIPSHAKDISQRHVTQNTVIELIDDIIIDTKNSPVLADPNFGSLKPAKVIFTSKTNKKVIVAKTGIWDLTSFNSKNKIIEFKGNAQLICEPGAKIIFNNGLLRFSDATKWIIN